MLIKKPPASNITFNSGARRDSRNRTIDQLQAFGPGPSNPILNQTVKTNAVFWPDHDLTQRPLYAVATAQG